MVRRYHGSGISTVMYVFLLCGVHAAAAEGAAPAYIIFDPPGSVNTIAAGITVEGAVVGSFIDSKGNTHGYIRNPDGAFTQIDVPGAQATQPTSINGTGEIVGAYCVAKCVSNVLNLANAEGFVRFPSGKYRKFSVPPCCSLLPFLYAAAEPSINAAGEVAGDYATRSGKHGEYGYVVNPEGKFITVKKPGVFLEVLGVDDAGNIFGDFGSATVAGVGFVLTKKGVFAPIDIPGCTRDREHSIAFAANHAGTIVGTASCNSRAAYNQGYVRTPDGIVTLFDPPGSSGGQAVAINDAGVTAGFATGFAFIRTPDGRIVSLNLPGSEPSAINDHGVVAGTTGSGNGHHFHGFIWFTQTGQTR